MWPFYSTMRNITFHKNVYVETLSTTSPVKLLKFKPSIITATLAHPKWTIPSFWANKNSQTYITKPFIKKMKYNIKIYISEKKWIFSIKNYVQKNYAKFATSKFTWKKLPKLQHPDLHGQKKTLTLQYPNLREPKNLPNLQHQTLCEQKNQIHNTKIYMDKKNAKFTTSKFAWAKKTPNSQHQNLREQKKTPNSQHQNLREQKKRQIYNIKIYVNKKNAKFTTSKFTWKTKTRNSQHQLQHRGQHWTCAKTQIEGGVWTNL